MSFKGLGTSGSDTLAATRLQKSFRKYRAKSIVAQMQRAHAVVVSVAKDKGIMVGGRRVQPWSEESAQLALQELGGKLNKEKGTIMWPKGTVEKLLIERTKYKDVINQHKRRERQALEAANAAQEAARQAVAGMKAQPSVSKQASENDPEWRVEDWIQSLNIAELLGSYLTEQLKVASSDSRAEKAFISKLGGAEDGQGPTSIIRGLLEPVDGQPGFLASVSAKLAQGSKDVAQQLAGHSEGDDETSSDLAGKFFEMSSGVQLVFGNRTDFASGLEGLIGAPDEVSLMGGMKRDHIANADSRTDFTSTNYGITTTSETEFWFVVDPSDNTLEKIGRDGWPVEAKLMRTTETRKLCRKPIPLSEFSEVKRSINARLETLKLSLTDEMFIGARLYTGPTFIKYNTILRAAPGRVPFFTEQMKKLVLGNVYATTLHVVNSALQVLSTLTKSQKVYRGISGGLLPPSFNEADEVAFKGGIEYAFMSTTSDRDVAVNYARASGNGLVFEFWMGIVDKGANLSDVSQYPHEHEICFPPLTALETRGTRIDGALTIIEADTRVCNAMVEREQSIDLIAFKDADRDASGELDRDEFFRLARHTAPTSSDVMLDRLFEALDTDGSRTISFKEFRDNCVPELEAEAAAAARRERELAIRTQVEGAKRDLASEHERKLDELATVHSSVLQQLNATHSIKLQDLISTHEKQLQVLTQKLDAVSGAQDEKLAALSKSHHKTLMAEKDSHATSTVSKMADYVKENEDLKSKIEEVKQENMREVERITEKHKSAVASANERNRKETQTLKREMASREAEHKKQMSQEREANKRAIVAKDAEREQLAEKVSTSFKALVSKETQLQTKAIAQMAAETMIGASNEAATMSAFARARKLEKLTRAFESSTGDQQRISARTGLEQRRQADELTGILMRPASSALSKAKTSVSSRSESPAAKHLKGEEARRAEREWLMGKPASFQPSPRGRVSSPSPRRASSPAAKAPNKAPGK